MGAGALAQVRSQHAGLYVPDFGAPSSSGDWSAPIAAAYAAAVAAMASGSSGGTELLFPGGPILVGQDNPGNPGIATVPASRVKGAPGVIIGGSTSAPFSVGVRGVGATSTVIEYPPGYVGNAIQDSTWGVVTNPSYQPSVDGVMVQCTASVRTTNFPAWTFAVTGAQGSGSSAFSSKPAIHAGGLFATSVAWVGIATNGLPVSATNPGYCWIADQLVQYTGWTTSTLGGQPVVILTGAGTGSVSGLGGNCLVQGSSYTFVNDFGTGITSATGPNLLHARVYPFDQTGHGIAFQGSASYVGHDTEVNYSVGHGIALQGGGAHSPSGSSWAGADWYPRRMYGNQWCPLFFGPGTSDVRWGLGSWHGYYGSNEVPNGNTDGGMYGGVLVGEGDGKCVTFHVPGAPGQDVPSVIICGGDAIVNDLTKDTSTAPAILWDNSGHWTQPSAIKNSQLNGCTYETPGLPNPIPAPATGGGVPALTPGLVAPLILKTAAANTGSFVGATYAQRGGLSRVSMNAGYEYGIQEGPQTALLGGGAPVDLSAAGSTFAAVGVINAGAIYGFDPFGNGDGLGGFPIAVGAESITYTGIVRSAAVTVGAQTLAASGTTVLNLGKLGATSALPPNWPTVGIAIANPAASSSPLQGPIILPYTAATGGQITVTITAQNASAVLGAGTIVTVHQFTGCAGGTGTTPDLTLATQPMRNVTGTKVGGNPQTAFQFADWPQMGGGPLALAQLNPGSTVFSALATTSAGQTTSPWTFVNRTSTFTAGTSEWSIWTPGGAGKVATLPAGAAGLVQVIELDTTIACTVAGNGAQTITVPGSAASNTQALTTAGTWQYTWDTVNTTWRATQI